MTAYQVLARKWRPKTFADLVGQQHVVKALKNALDKGRLHHAYLLTGTRGVGKTTIARILAKSLNCENATHGEPCGACQSCRDIDAGRFVDLLEIDAASNTGIDNIREVLENAQYAPTVGKYKVYIIDEVHMLSKSAFNAMLKTLEEPPEHVKFILATTDPHKVPITVLSRCLQFVLRNMTAQQVAEHLTHVLKTEQIVYEPAALALLGRAAQGSMRDALSLLDQAIAMGSGSVQERDVRDMIGAVDKRYLYELLTFLMEQDGESLIAKAQEMSANAIGFDSALNDLAMLLQRLALLKTVPSAIEQDDPERERLLHLAQYFSDEQIQLYYQCVIHGKNDLPLAPDEYAGFVMTLLRMLAFAPFAAKNTPTHGTIEGTQLHTPPENEVAKSPPELAKPLSGSLKNDDVVKKEFRHDELPPLHPEEIRRQAPVSVQAAKPIVAHVETAIQPAENLSENVETEIQPAEIISEKVETEIQPAENFSENMETEIQPAENFSKNGENEIQPAEIISENVGTEIQAAENLSENVETEIQPAEIISENVETEIQPAEIISENVETEIQPAENFSENVETEIQPAEHLSENMETEIQPAEHFSENMETEIQPDPTDYYDYDFESLPTTRPTAYAATLPEQSFESQPVDVLSAPSVDLPEFAAGNWLKILSYIAPQVAAAQMMLHHLAWLDWDGNTLTLALEEGKTEHNPEYVQRIERALCQTYGLDLRVAITAWLPEMHIETADMFAKRQAAERLAAAKDILANNPVAQKMRALFRGEWRENTIVLLDPQ